MPTPRFIAHRGYAASYPENTLLAIDMAYRAGARYVEVDVQLSADRVPVLFHDRSLERLCCEPGAIHDYPYARLKHFSVAYPGRFGDRFRGNRMATLQQLVDYLIRHPDLTAFIELKRLSLEVHGQSVMVETVCDTILPVRGQVTVISYNHAALRQVADTGRFTTGAVIDHWHEYRPDRHWQPEWLFCNVEGLPADLSAYPDYPTLAVFEVGEVQLAHALLRRGITYLETFHIGEMLRAFADARDP